MTMNKTAAFCTISLGLGFPAFAVEPVEIDFFTDTIGSVDTVVNIIDYGANGSDTNEDSVALQNAIDDMTALSHGGKIIVPEGTFILGRITMRSNVHLVISTNAVIKPIQTTAKVVIFEFGTNDPEIRNVSIRGDGGRFTVDFSDRTADTSHTAFMVQNVTNFMIAGVDIPDNFTTHSAIRCNMATYQGQYFTPRNGVIKNINNTSAHVGYGTVQIGAGTHILFKDLDGDGGVTLRAESGATGLGVLTGSMFDIYGRNISGGGGNAVVMISPHAMQNGHIDIDGVLGRSSVHAVRIDKGDTRNGTSPGWFADTSIVKNVHAIYGVTAQLKAGHDQWVPCELKYLISSEKLPDGKARLGPAAAAMRNLAEGTGEGYYNVTITNVTQEGFVYQTKTVQHEADSISKNQCPAHISVTGVSVDPTNATLSVSETMQLLKLATPNNATDPTVSWSSDNDSIATVNSDGLITAQSNGTAAITATTTDSSHIAVCAVTVVPANPAWDAFVSSYGLSGVKTNHADGDGLNDWGEYVFGGNPTNPSDTGIKPAFGDSAASNVIFSLVGDNRVTAYVLTTTNLLAGNWETSTTVNVSTTNGVLNSYTNSIDTTPPQLFIQLEAK
ncbi:Ig-like domain-containing protein [Pontiella sulfatireligans]|uniref:Iota-carrageenase n=1 Tax=Pontiella sulfatireligans TaxID=2750658 RepID=A0A6C2UGH1_9BACT|nr:Ig-like domain-containing protein [Pontiella sulfatireligans]VGO18306.1 Iota-carrageenase [Pontiella sulfatireligans]